jgi:hypothetical protein
MLGINQVITLLAKQNRALASLMASYTMEVSPSFATKASSSVVG